MKHKFILAMTTILSAAFVRTVQGQCTLPPCPSHIVCGQSPDGGPPQQLFTAPPLVGQSGHGTSFDPAIIQPIPRILLNSSYAQPRFGGYSFSPTGIIDTGMDFDAPSCVNTGNTEPCDPDPQSHNLALAFTNPPVSSFTVYARRLSYNIPTEFSMYSPSGLPQMTEDVPFGDPISPYDYGFGDQSNGGHVHPLFLMRRPGLLLWNMRFVSTPGWGWSDPYTFQFTSVPGRGLLVPINMSSIFNADVVDSDGSDTPAPFDANGNSWVLNGNYGTTNGLPTNGQLDGFQLGGLGGAGLTGSNNNVLLANGSLNLASNLNLVTLGQADNFLSLEFLVAGAGTFTSSDIISVTLTYADASTATIQIRQTSASWSPYRPLDNWQQTTTPLPWTAIGASGDRAAGFSRSTGSAIDGPAGSNTYFFRACTPVDNNKVLNQIAFANYAGTNRVGVFAILAIKKAPLSITTASLPVAQEGMPYSQTMSAVGTPPAKNWQTVGLPTGLLINSTTGLISGTPVAGTAAASPYSVTISCQDSIHDYDSTWPVENANVILSLAVSTRPGDINGDGLVDNTDLGLFVNVLLGLEANPTYVSRSDLNSSGSANGMDISPFVTAYLH